jgi:endoglucanase
MLTGSNLLQTKQFNLRIVHETIRLHGPLSRADVARHTALTGQTVSNLVRELIDLGLVLESARRSEGRGAPSTDLAVNPEGAFAIGIDFNREHVTGVLVDLSGAVRQRVAHEVDFPTPAETLDLMTDMTESLIASQGIARDRVRGVGIGVPGLMLPAPSGEGYVVAPTAFPGWHDVPLAAWLEQRIGLPVLLENNATAAAVGERWYGAGRQFDTFFYVFLGSGLGGGLIVNGRPYGGATGNAGEIAYLPPRLDADPVDGDHAGSRFYLPFLLEQLRAAGAPARTIADLGPLPRRRPPDAVGVDGHGRGVPHGAGARRRVRARPRGHPDRRATARRDARGALPPGDGGGSRLGASARGASAPAPRHGHHRRRRGRPRRGHPPHPRVLRAVAQGAAQAEPAAAVGRPHGAPLRVHRMTPSVTRPTPARRLARAAAAARRVHARLAPARLAGVFAAVFAAPSTAPAQPAAAAAGPEAATRIRVNQVGFYPAGPKAAVVVDTVATRFAVLTAERGDTVFAGSLSPARRWTPSGEDVRLADFGRLARPGRYVVAVAGVGRSHPFVVAPDAARAVARAALKSYYYQRTATPLAPRYAGPWSRPAGHPDTAVLVHPSAAGPGRPAGTRIAAPGGWYDAGDYNKYVVNSGISTYTLLAVADHFPAYAAALEADVPESGNTLPDVLDEALWNLRWMRTMQDPADGGVYHKLTNADFDGFVMPHAATRPRYVVQKGTAAALDFAATAAYAARVVRRHGRALPGLADSLVREAAAAWTWARQHPDSAYDQERLNAAAAPRVNTGAYGDRSFGDEFRWAAAELYLATRQDSFFVAAAPLAGPPPDLPSWASVGTLGLYSLVDGRGALPAGFDTAALRARLVAAADALADAARASAYGVPSSDPRDFVWGSSAVAANQGVLLVQAHRLTGDRRYLDAAAAALDYLLGRNATGYSFVTGHGAVTPRFPHHRPSAADTVAAPVPGLLVGGPNPGQQDRCAGYPSRLPALSYVDSTCSYASNEVAINWNAPLVYLAAAVDAAYGGPGPARPTPARPARPAPAAPASRGRR